LGIDNVCYNNYEEESSKQNFHYKPLMIQ